jgi:nucleotide-binding universal stress UspA family protein
MYRMILVPLDGSGRAEAILPHVESLAAAHESKVIFLRVLEPSRAIIDPHETMVSVHVEEIKRQEAEAKAYLAARQGEFRERHIEAETRLAHGPVAATIVNVAASEGADLIAMASHGRGGLARAFYGSVAAGVLQRIDRPLLLVRSRPVEVR